MQKFIKELKELRDEAWGEAYTRPTGTPEQNHWSGRYAAYDLMVKRYERKLKERGSMPEVK